MGQTIGALVTGHIAVGLLEGNELVGPVRRFPDAEHQSEREEREKEEIVALDDEECHAVEGDDSNVGGSDHEQVGSVDPRMDQLGTRSRPNRDGSEGEQPKQRCRDRVRHVTEHIQKKESGDGGNGIGPDSEVRTRRNDWFTSRYLWCLG